ncbi:hypothetical protein KIF59_16330 [Enterobacter cloacae subsp. cloacae]|nr:hypothetical protein [Enterobacter cloacae subsp. cloacae]
MPWWATVSSAGGSWGYSSIWDVIFLHDRPADVMTDGERKLTGAVLFTSGPARLCTCSAPARHRGFCMKWMPARQSVRRGWHAGDLNGIAADYQKNSFDVEHQALVRAAWCMAIRS